MSKKNSVLANRIKRMMQADEDVGKISQQTPVVIAHTMEIFLDQLAKGASAVATTRGDKTLNTSHLKEFVNTTPSMDFLREIVTSAPELKEKPATPAGKRQRKSGDETSKPGRKKAKKPPGEEGEDAAPKKRGRAKKSSEVQAEEQKYQAETEVKNETTADQAVPPNADTGLNGDPDKVQDIKEEDYKATLPADDAVNFNAEADTQQTKALKEEREGNSADSSILAQKLAVVYNNAVEEDDYDAD